MPRALIIKTSSMGDLLHTLPAVSDTQAAHPDWVFDWVCDNAFSEIPQWHPAVDTVITTQLRQWRRSPGKAIANGAIKRLYQTLRAQTYDVVIDAQLSLKSAFLTRLAKGPKHGGDRRSTREALASWAYQHQYRVAYEQHAITRIRKLFAQVFQYPYQASEPDYGIDLNALEASPIELDSPYAVCVHNASWETKQWPSAYWRQMIHWLTQAGIQAVLPWGTAEEKAQAMALAGDNPRCTVLPKCTLSQLATLLQNAQGAISCDTGLAHLAAALGTPNVTLYGPTNPTLIGTMGAYQTHLAAEFACAPCYRKQCAYPFESSQQPACFTMIPPERVWSALQALGAVQ